MNRIFRVIRRDSPSGRAAYVIYQVHYDEQGAVQLVSADPVSPCRDTLAELRDDLERMQQALELPALQMGDVLDSLEASGATAYGRWIREQIMDSSSEDATPVATTGPHDEMVRAERRKLEMIAENFAEKRRNDPSFG